MASARLRAITIHLLPRFRITAPYATSCLGPPLPACPATRKATHSGAPPPPSHEPITNAEHGTSKAPERPPAQANTSGA